MTNSTQNPSQNPTIVDNKPTVMQLEAGKYYWCSCGLSTNQPFCNGGHKGTEFTPVAFEITEKQTVAVCQCKYTANAPFCDGSHIKLNSASSADA
jgi:CDGSH iron-sulfur domain-containing protein 3